MEHHVAAMWNTMWLPCEPPSLGKLSRTRHMTCLLSQNMLNLARDLVDTCTHAPLTN
jgi:hypothetical protein